MSPLRFCMVTTYYPPENFGGDGIAVQRLARGLVRRGHRVTVVYDSDAYTALSSGAKPSREPPTDDGVEVVRLESRAPLLSILLTQQTGRPIVQGARLAQILGGHRFDVVNYHNVSLVGGVGVLGLGDPAIRLYMMHEHWLVCPQHVLWRHDREPCPGRQCLRCAIHYHRPPQLWRNSAMMDRQLRHVDTFIALSEFSRDKHREFGFEYPMEVLPNFVPDSESPASEPGAPSWNSHSRPYFLYVGRLQRIKGLDDVIPVFREDLGADLLIAGTGTHEAELRRLAGESERIKFLGWRNEAELAGLYRDATALIVPSRGFETFGMILTEAFQQGTPVLARRIGPFPEIVGQAGAGLLFDSPDELREGVRRFLGEPGLRSRFALAGQAAFQQRWTERTVVSEYLDIIRRTAVRKGRPDLVEALTPALVEAR